ncbi:hypothetical protein KL941_001068 [Ogataea angusta]|nr:hypothetical protein KL941_001068 [Ogataea angusta]
MATELIFDQPSVSTSTSQVILVERQATSTTESALELLDGAILAEYPINISWAFQTQRSKSSNFYNIFVGDLWPDVNDEMLGYFFGKYRFFGQAIVMWDMKSGRSRGYGFVSFQDVPEAENCLYEMNGAILGGQTLRLNTANRKSDRHQPSKHYTKLMHSESPTIPSNPLNILPIPLQTYMIQYTIRLFFRIALFMFEI